MDKIKFKDVKLDGPISITLSAGRKWNGDKWLVIKQCNEILRSYKTKLTLRQLYYQLVARDYIPNHQKVYAKLSKIVRDARLAGFMDWSSIEDRIRIARIPDDWEDPRSAIKSLYHTYKIRRTRDQDIHLELWCEKDAISSILSPITNYYHVHLMVNRGYGGWSAFYDAYNRMWPCILSGRRVEVLYLGDHDPSGIDMIRDIYDRLFLMFANMAQARDGGLFDDDGFVFKADGKSVTDGCMDIIERYANDDDCNVKGEFSIIHAWVKDHFKVTPIGLTIDQVRELKPPPNPAKIDDPRAKDYIKKYGAISWEVDAIPPDELEDIVTDSIRDRLDMDKWYEVYNQEVKDKSDLLSLVGLSEDDL